LAELALSTRASYLWLTAEYIYTAWWPWVKNLPVPANAASGKYWGATHACEMAFTFNTVADPDSSGFVFHDRNDPTVRELALNWSNTLIAMAKTGNPNGAGLPDWPAYDDNERQCLILDGEPRIESNPDADHLKLWGNG
jgi:para-nitrobenzyl esterase